MQRGGACPLSRYSSAFDDVVDGFTLAEILITLAVIGIVLMFTLPTLLSNYQKKVTASKLKQAYSIFYQALEHAEVDYGPSLTWKLSESDLQYNSVGSPDFRRKYLENYLRVVEYKVYGYKPTEQQSYLSKVENSAGVSLSFIGIPDSNGVPCLSNGICFWLAKSGDENVISYIYLMVDLDGPSGKNRMGRDIFAFHINYLKTSVFRGGLLSSQTVYGINLANADETTVRTRCNDTDTIWSNGFACTELIMRNNWKIPDEYPW